MKGIKGMRLTRVLAWVAGWGMVWNFVAPCGLAQAGAPAQPAAATSADKVLADKTATDKTATDKTATTPPPQLEARESRYALHAGDAFDINFELSPEYNQSGVTVQPDGFITLRGVGDVFVDGQTVPQLTETLRTSYAKILHDPIISVILKDFEKPYFVADGQIGRPGKYDLRGTVTLSQALAIAGGVSDNGKYTQVMLFRRVNDQWLEAKLFNMKKMHKTGKMDEDPFLHSGDMLFVPKTAYSKFSRFIPQASLGTMLRPY